MSDITATKRALVIIGAGPAGMSAAVAAYDHGIRDILIIERDNAPGGILRQCIHNGFGLHTFKEELTGPEFAYRFEKQVRERGIEMKLNTMVLDITPNRVVTAINEQEGVFTIEAGAVILAMGCRERSKGALNIPGTRPAGVFTAGTAQKYVNMEGYMPGKEVVILGSGDIGLIMARRMTLEGAVVKAVCEIMPYSNGLARNIEQCLNDFNIPLLLSHTVVKLHGRERLTGVTIAEVDAQRRPIESTKKFIQCDTLLLSVGLIPENELSKSAEVVLDRMTGGAEVDEFRQTSTEGIFACGNVLHVHDLADFAADEGAIAGRAAVDYLTGNLKQHRRIRILTDGRVRYTVPQYVTCGKDMTLYYRVSNIFKNATVGIYEGERKLLGRKKIKLAPGEMETITLPAALIESIVGDTIRIGIEEDK
ncbi:MAG: NAD(P)/FAD-dependent oxidoreductase [Eubacteriales bacterium]|jgi:NADPH-dependent 2,4-dienoyl-CoA reductase/sulfur reductase-like enzyme